MAHHKNLEISSLIQQLIDKLSSYERTTGRESTLILVPHSPDETIVVAQTHRPFNFEPGSLEVIETLELAFHERDKELSEWLSKPYRLW